ncbi:MAG: type I pullulanase [Streptococcaceae bacterium]|jgi:pullulanase|nr:type I pullulanase [Streptococcaceae bacterium]
MPKKVHFFNKRTPFALLALFGVGISAAAAFIILAAKPQPAVSPKPTQTTLIAGTTSKSAASQTSVTETVKFQAPNSTTQYYVYSWDDNAATDGLNYAGGFTAIPKGQTNGTESLALTVSPKMTGLHFFITDGNDWSKNPTKFDADGANGVTVSMAGGSQTTFVSPSGYGVTVASSNAASASDQYAALSLADEYQAAKQDNFTAFDSQWAYEGQDLGATYTSTATTYKVWAPTATKVTLISYGTNTSPTATQVSSTPMVRGLTASSGNHATNTVGVWSLTVPGNQAGVVYQYQLTFADGTVSDYPTGSGKAAYGTYIPASVTTTTQDPYTIAATQGGLRSVVENPASLVPTGFNVSEKSAATWRVSSPTQMMVDELHVRDFTYSVTSGVASNLRGKFLGVVQRGTTDPNTGMATGLDYLKQTGFNYVQIMPSYDYASVPESGVATPAQPNVYNWGYDPQNYNVPEGEYATNSLNPVTRILEMKEMVQGLHNDGMGVIMDVVYNHVYSQSDSSFEKTEPGYYFRKTASSGCGNDTASNHEMFQKYILDSVSYWAKNFDVDGFRFDLMANIDTSTMNKVRATLSAIDPHLVTYGEGWAMGTDVPYAQQTAQDNAKSVPGIGFFNDGERDSIKQNFASENFGAGSEINVVKAILGSGSYGNSPALKNYLTPSQSVNYVDCHDGYTLNDQLWLNNPKDTQAQHVSRVQFASAVSLLADGISFQNVGQEFLRTKNVTVGGVSTASIAGNSYNGVVTQNGTNYYLGDAMNAINWDLTKTNATTVSYLSNLMKFKAANPSFWPDSYSTLSSEYSFTNMTQGSGLISYEMKNSSGHYLIILNASGKSVKFGTGGTYYASSNLTGDTLTLTNDTTLSAQQGKALTTSSVTLSDLTATIIKLKN